MGDTNELDVPETPEVEKLALEQGTNGFPVVGIGASAGGLAAFESFFSAMGPETMPGMAFVLVQHLAPDHKSMLAELIRRYTHMEVHEVEDGMQVKPNCAYIIPPNHDMALLGGALHLMEPGAPRGQRLPVDFFFRSLAQDQRERAICVVLSGTGSDGSMGLRAVKGEGGMVMAQTPDSADYDGMPRSAIGTGLIDFVLKPGEMPAQLLAYASHAFGRLKQDETIAAPKAENAIRKVFILLRAQTGHDFSQYKPSTIHRRIDRRMAVHQIETIEAYTRFLHETPAEVELLFRDLLIGVTSFFRDSDAFHALEQHVLPKLFADKPAGAVVRCWSVGCSTGEEAYSLAMLLQERVEGLRQSFQVQVFATDIDSQAIATARAGIYPASIATDISPERLARFFVMEPDGGTCRIHKSIRDMLVFSEQDVIKDPPFSRLDLISCRNLLIYMGGELQKKVIPLFHYALKPDGFLFLGNSETVGDAPDLFSAVDRKAKLYQRKSGIHSAPRAALGNLLSPVRNASVLPSSGSATAIERPTLRELTEQALLQQVAPAAALVNDQGDILYLHGRTGSYLELAPGEVGVSNILKMAREGLRRELTMALHKAMATKEAVRAFGLRVKTNGDFTMVNLTVRPAGGAVVAPSEPPLFLVVLEEALGQEQLGGGVGPVASSAEVDADADARIAILKKELRTKEEYLQTSNEELETSNEELKSSNEEMQSVNEELQSTNEELETSKEELQSVNEELATVNVELQTKVADLTTTNNDMNNLLAGTGIGTVFVDHQLRIVRFTPAVTKTINLIQGDIGRPVGHIVSNLIGYDHLVADTQSVLDTLIPKEVEVQSRSGAWYSMRILPYRTLDNVIEGAVITFVDTTSERRTREALRETESCFRQLVGSLQHSVCTFQPDGTCDYLSPQWIEFTGVAETPQLGFGWLDQIHPTDRSALTTVWAAATASGEPFQLDFRLRHHSGDYAWHEMRATGVRDSADRIAKWFAVSVDISNRGPRSRDPSSRKGDQPPKE